MKRSRLLALTLVVALLLMGAGYAFWSETLTIDATVSTGELDFEFLDSSNFVSGGDYVVGAQNYVKGTANVNSDDPKTLDLTLENMHPGATAKFKLCIKNTGTIGLKLEDFVLVGDSPNLAQLQILDDSKNLIGIDDYLQQFEGTIIDVGKERCVNLVFAVYKCATEEQFEKDIDFDFSIRANVKQYNDDGSCGSGEPGEEDPEESECPSGLKFVQSGDPVEVKRWSLFKGWYDTGHRKISGVFYYTCEGQNDVRAGTIKCVQINKNRSKQFTYGDFTIEIKNTGGEISWKEIES